MVFDSHNGVRFNIIQVLLESARRSWLHDPTYSFENTLLSLSVITGTVGFFIHGGYHPHYPVYLHHCRLVLDLRSLAALMCLMTQSPKTLTM
jgi:hypothetical protein